MVGIRTVGTQTAGLAWVALRAFVTTLAAFAAAGAVLAGVAYYFLREPKLAYGILGAVVALAESLATGFFLGLARAKAATVAHALGKLRLGRSLVALVFDRMLGVAGGDPGERDGKVARGLERVPLAKAEEWLTRAARGVIGEPESVGWLRRRVRTALTKAVHRYTLARFRADGTAHGGVDLLKVRGELEDTIDDALVAKVRGGLRVWLWLAILGLPAAIAAQIYFVMGLLK
jgi:hypothetical protein